MPDIIAQGFQPSFGAGPYDLHRFFGVPVPGVYVSQSFETAKSYPLSPETSSRRVPESRSGVGGGEYIADDGTLPMKVVIRMLADMRNHLFRDDGRAQWTFRPQYLYISRMFIYTTAPRLCIQAPRSLVTVRHDITTMAENEAVLTQMTPLHDLYEDSEKLWKPQGGSSDPERCAPRFMALLFTATR